MVFCLHSGEFERHSAFISAIIRFPDLQKEESKLNTNSINLEQHGFHMFMIHLRLLGDHVHSTRIAFVIMTSNVGSSVIEKGGRGIGF